MKGTLVGKQKINYTRDGESRTMLVLHVTFASSRVDGLATDQVRVYGNQDCYSQAFDLPLDCQVDIDYNQRGMVDNITQI